MCSIERIEGRSSAELTADAERVAAALAAGELPESAGGCMAEVEQIGRILDLLETAVATRVRRVDASGEVRAWGYPSTTAWLRDRLGTRHSRAAERLALARQLPRLPRVAKRLAASELSHGYATAIAGGVKYLDDDDTAAAEDILLDLIDDGASVADVTRTCARITDVIAERDRRDPRPRSPRQGYRRSWLSVGPDLDGRGAHVTGWLTAAQASMLRQACAPLAVPAGAGDDRDHAQRFADALYMRLSQGGSRWSATVVIDASTLAGSATAPGTPAAPSAVSPEVSPAVSSAVSSSATSDLHESVRRHRPWRPWPARTLDGLTLSSEQARQIAIDAGVSTLILGAGGLPLYLGRQTRVVTAGQRKTLMALYETCIADGCIIPAQLCQIDHLNPWFPRGRTDIDNLAPECAFHNRYKNDHPERVEITRHRDRWRYRIHHPQAPPMDRPPNGEPSRSEPP